MKKITAKIDGMMCGMCEAHICDAIRKAFPKAKKVTASRKSGEASFLTDAADAEDTLKKAIAETGYMLLSVSSETYEKHGLFGK